MRCLPTKVDWVQGCEPWAKSWKGEGSVFPDWLRAVRVSVWLGSASKHIGIVSLHSIAGLSVDLILIRFFEFTSYKWKNPYIILQYISKMASSFCWILSRRENKPICQSAITLNKSPVYDVVTLWVIESFLTCMWLWFNLFNHLCINYTSFCFIAY